MAAAKAGHLGVIELLVSKGALLEAVDKEGSTALSLAAEVGQLETTKDLLGRGADVNSANKVGQTPLDKAAAGGNEEVVAELLEQGALMEHLDIQGRRPLDRAIAHSHAEVVKVFLRKGAKLGPSTWQEASGKPDIMLILLNKLLEDGNTLYKKGRLEEAAMRYTYANKRVPVSLGEAQKSVFQQLRVHLLLNLSRCRRKQGRLEEARRLASEALTVAPSCPEALHARAKASHVDGKHEAALRDLTQAVRIAPHNKELCKILLNLKLEMKESEIKKISDSKDSSSGICSSGEGSSKDFDAETGSIL